MSNNDNDQPHFIPDHQLSPDLKKALEGVHWVLIYNRQGHGQPFVPGCMFYIVVDQNKEGGVIPLVVTHMSKRTLRARCGCGKPDCNRKVSMNMTWTGNHPQIHNNNSITSKDKN